VATCRVRLETWRIAPVVPSADANGDPSPGSSGAATTAMTTIRINNTIALLACFTTHLVGDSGFKRHAMSDPMVLHSEHADLSMSWFDDACRSVEMDFHKRNGACRVRLSQRLYGTDIDQIGRRTRNINPSNSSK
jgi:hypothetical protein